MALVIRLRKMGKKNHQTFRLVVLDERKPRDGKYIEMLGWYNPFEEDKKNVCLDAKKIEFWLQKGAMLSQKAKSLVKRVAPEVIKSTKKEKTKSESKK